MPIFMVIFGGTLDELGEIPEDGQVVSVQESVKRFVWIFVMVGGVSMVSGFAMVALWTIAGECQVTEIVTLGRRAEMGLCWTGSNGDDESYLWYNESMDDPW